jgi:SAM-dependent methyltransferase
MTELAQSSQDLQKIYQNRFQGKAEYRTALWRVLVAFFDRWIPKEATVLDLGCGYCEFINNVICRRKFAMDLNPDARRYASQGVTLIEQDCSTPWQMEKESLDVVFTSNFFEHLPSKTSLESTLREVFAALKPGGCLIALGPNVKFLPGAYWDFFDHYIPLTELSLVEVLEKLQFKTETVWDRFLPYTMSQGNQPPLWQVKLYLQLPVFWRFFGKQFLVVSRKA